MQLLKSASNDFRLAHKEPIFKGKMFHIVNKGGLLVTIKHILKDGTVLKDIRGHVVKMEDAKSIYSLMDKMNQKKEEKS